MCFQDESVSVREAAVDLLGKHISARQDLALAYFDILATAVRDLGTSVRKRAINIMWESCIQQPGFQRASDACVHILGRISDSEESIQKLVSKIFHSLWFSGMLCRLLCMPERCSDTCLCAASLSKFAIQVMYRKLLHGCKRVSSASVMLLQQSCQSLCASTASSCQDYCMMSSADGTVT